MSRWFRFYDDTLNDPKTLKLSDKTFRIWVMILCAASKNDGKIPFFEDLVILLRIKAAKLQPEIEKLITAELIDHDDNGMRPHNWDRRQYKSDVADPTNAERQQRYRERHRNAVTTVTPKRPDTEAETDTEPEAEQTSQLPSPIELKNLSLGEVKREVSPPRHCAQTSKGGGRVYIVKGTPEWDAYSEDFRVATGYEPIANEHGGRWFKTMGETA